MWVARFTLRDDEDIYSPLCKKWNVEFFAVPHTHFTKNDEIHLLVSGVLSGSVQNTNGFLQELKSDGRIDLLPTLKGGDSGNLA